MKKTHFGKIMCAVLAVLMVLSTSIVAFAAPTQTGTVTVKNVTAGETYSFYRLLDLAYTDNGDGTKNYSYTVNSDFDKFFAGLSIDGYVEDANITSAESKAAYDYIAAQSTPEQISVFAAKVVKFAKANNIASNPAAVTATDDSDIVINDVPAGYYVMVPASANSDVLTSALFSITTLSDAVSIINKSVYPSIVKKIIEDGTAKDKVDAAFGDTVTYQLASNVPSSMNGYESYAYKMTDKISAGLAYNDDVTVKVGAKTLTKDTDYTVATADGTMTINFVDFIQYNTAEFRGKDIIVTYTAKVIADANLGSAGNDNTAGLIVSNNPADETSTVTISGNTVNVYTAGLQFKKVNAGSKALEGAKFTIDMPYVSDAVIVAGSIDSNVYTTGDNGIISVTGIKEGTYTITETEAPTGYAKLDNPIQIKITFDEVTGTFTAALVGEDAHVSDLVLNNDGANAGVATFNVINETMSILPETGAVTTIICVGAGFVCLAVAGVLIMTSKKKKASSAE